MWEMTWVIAGAAAVLGAGVVYLVVCQSHQREVSEMAHQLQLAEQRMEDIQARLDTLLNDHDTRGAELEDWRAKAGEEGQRAVRLESDLSSRLREKQELQERASKLERQLAEITTERDRIAAAMAALETDLQKTQQHHEEKLKLLTEAREQLTHEFKALAGQIMTENSERFTAQNRENIETVLKPLNSQLKDFQKRVEETYDKESKQRFSLQEEVKKLQDLNQRISEDAINLTNALKGESKTQGNWGEVVLERLLEKSGLVKGREYEVQVNLKTDDGKRFQPDVLVHLPDSKEVVIDSKVSLTAYERYHSLEEPAEREQELKAHILSVKKHIKELARKDYHALPGITSLDFVLLFIPVEGAFSLAIQEEPALFNEAFDQNIVIVSPSTLLATLRTINNIWRYEYQSRHAQEIAGEAGKLYDKFVGFVEDLENIGSRLTSTQDAWDKAHNKLVSGRGNLIRRAEQLKKLGAKTSKALPQSMQEQDDGGESPALIEAGEGESGAS